MNPGRWGRRGLALVGLGAVGGAAGLTLRHALMTPQPLASGLPGEARIDREHGGELYYTVSGPAGAQPIVLLHDFYPGASSYEYGSLFPRLADTYRVYAPDWLGFGMSERPPLAYTGEFYANMLAGFLRDVVAQPAVVVATGRAANIAARTASDTPALFDRLVLVSPHVEAGLQLDPTLSQALVRLAQRAALGVVPYALVSSRPMLRLFASRRGLGATAEDALDHEWAAAHQLGAQHAVLAALTGELDLPLQHVLPLLEPPVLLVGGEADRRYTREQMDELAILNPYAELDIIPGAGATVAQDQPARLATTLDLWLRRALPRHTPVGTLRAGSLDGTATGTPSRTSRRPTEAGSPRASGAAATLAIPPATSPEGADETPTAKRPAARKSAATRQPAMSQDKPRSAAAQTANGETRPSGPARETLQETSRETTEPGNRASIGTRSRAANPSLPRTRASAAPDVLESEPAEPASKSGRATVKPPTAGRDRSRSQTQPRTKRGSQANPEPEAHA